MRPPVLTTHLGALYRADCLDFLRALPDGCVQLIFCDPPFNLAKDYGRAGPSDERPEDEYLHWCTSWLDECCRVLSQGGALFVYHLPRWLLRMGAHLDERLQFRHWIALTMKSTFPRGKRLYPAHYGILYFTKGEPAVFNKQRLPIPRCRHCGGDIKDYGGHRNALHPDGITLTDFWEDTSPVRHQRFKTRDANELPIKIPERAILMATNPDDLVLDPFGGSGTTYVVAQKEGRRWLGCELGDCGPASKRLREAFPLMTGHPTGDWLQELLPGSD